MEVDKLRIHDVLTCDLDENVAEIEKRLKERGEKRIYIVDSKKVLKGVLTTTDLVYALYSKPDEDKSQLKAKDVMKSGVESVDIKESHRKALEIMNKYKTFMCPITRDGKLIGAISYEDVLAYATTIE